MTSKKDDKNHRALEGVYWFDPSRGKAWPFDGHYGGDDKLIKLVDQSIMPKDFICLLPNISRVIRFKRNDDGTFDQMLWNGEWIWDDNVGSDTASDYFKDPDTLVASFPVL